MSTSVDTADERTLLLAHEVIKRRLPENFRMEDLPLFEHELEKPIPETELLQLKNVQISSDGILFRGLKLLSASFAFPFLEQQWRTRSRVKFFLTNQLLRRRRRTMREAFWITDNWSYAYFHWLSDALAKLYVMRNRLPDLVLLLPSQYRSLPFVGPSLRAFGVSVVDYVEPDEVVTVERLTVLTPVAPSGHFREPIVKGVRDLMLVEYGSPKEAVSSDRLYISRGRALKRRLVNENEVVELLREFDFKSLRAEDLSLAEQIKAASRAGLLVSNHGAGLTNMLFMPGGSSVLELRHRTDSVNNCYFTLASTLGLKYFYQKCDPSRPTEDPHTADLVVDLADLRRNLEVLTAR